MDNIKSFVREDPVEKQQLLGLISFSDPLDGNNFTTDLDYGDLNNDTYIDVAVGRLPKDDTLASLMFARTYLPDNKNALVASEYLHQNWASILLYAGGGMWNGRTIANILEDQDYSVDRLVEHRANPQKFIESLTPTNVKDFLDKSKSIGSKIGSLLGKTVGNVISKTLIVLQGAHYAEQALEQYLEYDWSTFNPRWDDAANYLITSFPLNVENLVNYESLVSSLITDYLWPDPWKTLNQTNLISSLPDKSIVYYEGIGNGSIWILPNVFPEDTGFLGYQEFINSLENTQYNGSNSFYPSDIPNLDSKIVWDNSDLASTGDMMDSFITKGTASFIGSSAVNYASFSSEIDTRFFKDGATIGLAFIQAINNFRDDWLTWDPFNIFTQGGIKAKSLRSFILYGDPSMIKDPIIEKLDYTQTTNCNDSVCTTSVVIPLSYNITESNGNKTIETDASSYLLEPFKPIIPLKEFEYFLPLEATIINSSITTTSSIYQDITIPTLNLLSHSGLNFTSTNISNEYYPSDISRLEINKTIDNRTKIKLIHAGLQYNESSLTATVYDTIKLDLTYTTPIEFSASIQDILLGQTVSIPITIWSDVFGNATLYVTIDNQTNSQTFTQDFLLTQGINKLSFSHTPQTPGNYKASIILVKHDPITVGPRVITFSVNSDTIPPITSDNSDNSLHFTDQMITLTCTDDSSGCKQTIYCIDTTHTCSPDTVYSSPIIISCPTGNSCSNYVRYQSIDNFENLETIKTSNQIKIDKTVFRPLIVEETTINQSLTEVQFNQSEPTIPEPTTQQTPQSESQSSITGAFTFLTESTTILIILAVALIAVFVVFIIKFL